MTADNREANARDEVDRAAEALRAAEELLVLGLFNDSVSRAYYASYHWAKALLETAEGSLQRAPSKCTQ